MLAIVIPYYKINFFKETLQSLVLQTDRRFKVYIGDDASKDDPLPLLNEFIDKFDYEYKRFGSNLGAISLVAQWNRCLQMVQNEKWVTILGDDDFISSNFVASFYEKLDLVTKLQCDVIRFSSFVIDQKSTIISPCFTHPETENSTDFLMRKFEGSTRSSLGEFIFNKEKIDSIGFRDLPLAWYTDVLAFLEFSDFKTIFTINNAFYYFRHSPVNITSLQNNYKQKSRATFLFYDYLITKRSNFFSKYQLDILFLRLEKSFSNDKKNIYFWKRLLYIYISKYQFKRLVYFFLDIVKKIIKIK